MLDLEKKTIKSMTEHKNDTARAIREAFDVGSFRIQMEDYFD
jgi:hypothetical protein